MAAEELGICTEIEEITCRTVMQQVKKAVATGRNVVASFIKDTPEIDFVSAACHLIDDQTVEAAEKKRNGRKIFTASAARPLPPAKKGLSQVPISQTSVYWNSKKV